jgi:Fe-S cluster assembly ATP-binding protein
MLDIKNLTVSIEGKTILQNINVQFLVGTTTALLGPNGSGKSTLGNTIMGAPFITVTPDSSITLNGTPITTLPTHERARLGIFMTFQNPLPLSGVTAMDLFRSALVNGHYKKYSAKELHALVHQYAEELNLPKEFLKRSLYEGFSGGERKKMEALQAVLFAPKVVIFDELDTGVDVDALKTIVTFLKNHLDPETVRIFITHSHKLLKLYHPDHVVVLKNGSVVKTGGVDLAENIEARGFENL